MEEKIMKQKQVIEEIEKNIKGVAEDISFYKADVKKYEKIISMIAEVAEEQEKKIKPVIEEVIVVAGDIIVRNEASLEKLKDTLSKEKGTLKRLEKIQKEYSEITVHEVQTVPTPFANDETPAGAIPPQEETKKEIASAVEQKQEVKTASEIFTERVEKREAIKQEVREKEQKQESKDKKTHKEKKEGK